MPEASFPTGRRIAALALALACGACSTMAPVNAWEPRLRGPAVVLLGEVHDNGEHHRLRLDVLRRAFAAGWRPAIAMEQFDRERQPEMDRARREKPGDAQHLIDIAAAPSSRAGGGWNWDFYRPLVALALQYDLPLIAANLSNADTTRIVRGGHAAVFDAAAVAALGLDLPMAADWQASQEHEIDVGHCNALPPSLWPAMARAQFARDAVMAAALRQHAGKGVVLLAGNGHVRRDIGVPRWLGRAWADRVVAVGYVERGDAVMPAAAFDAVVVAAAAARPDPCIEFEKRTGPAIAPAGPISDRSRAGAR